MAETGFLSDLIAEFETGFLFTPQEDSWIHILAEVYVFSHMLINLHVHLDYSIGTL